MIRENKVVQIKRQLMSTTGHNLYAVIDGAATPELRFKLHEWAPESCCLYSGKLEPDMQEVAPYLVKLQPDCHFTDWLITAGWDENWNIFVESELPLKAMRKQMRKLLQMKTVDNEILLFRFYDPRVISIVAPVFDVGQAGELFENIVTITLAQDEALSRWFISPVDNKIISQSILLGDGS